MELGLAGRTALVTGASRGIGRAIAEVLAYEGCHLILVSRSATDLESARAEIRVAAHDRQIRVHTADLRGAGDRGRR